MNEEGEEESLFFLAEDVILAAMGEIVEYSLIHFWPVVLGISGLFAH